MHLRLKPLLTLRGSYLKVAKKLRQGLAESASDSARVNRPSGTSCSFWQSTRRWKRRAIFGCPSGAFSLRGIRQFGSRRESGTRNESGLLLFLLCCFDFFRGGLVGRLRRWLRRFRGLVLDLGGGGLHLSRLAFFGRFCLRIGFCGRNGSGRSSDGSSGSFALLPCFGGRGCSPGFRSGFGGASAAWRWRRRRRGRSERLQKFQRLGAREQLSVEQEQENFARQFWILRQLRCDQQLRHFRQRNLLLHLTPLSEVVLDFLLDRLLLRGHGEKKNHFRPRV